MPRLDQRAPGPPTPAATPRGVGLIGAPAEQSGVMPWAAFADDARDRAAFLARARGPLLVVWGAPSEGKREATHQEFGTLKVVGPNTAGPRPSTPWGVARVEKRPGSNAFSLMVTIGRAPNNDIVLPHPALSKFHAYLRPVGERWTLLDARSSNGTTHDGVAVDAERGVIVRSGSWLVLGCVVALELLDPEHVHDRLLGAGAS